MRTILYALVGYLSGSVLYAQIFARLFHKPDLIERSNDHNPGTANAFQYGGFWCGVLTLVCDLLKGFIPVFVFLAGPKPDPIACALVLAAPVIGHAFPVFYCFQGGKGIAVTFGCLLGLLPIWQPVATLAMYFILFSVVLQISPHFYRTLVAYLCALVHMIFIVKIPAIWMGFLIISGVVLLRLHMSKEQREQIEVKWVWTR